MRYAYLMVAVLALPLAAGSSPADSVYCPGTISTAAAEVRIAVRPDGQQILWGSIGRDAGRDQQDIWESHRAGDGWSAPARVAFDTDAVEFDPAFSPDGKTLYFDSDRPGGQGGTDIYAVDVAPGFAFGQPRHLGLGVNSTGDEWAATPIAGGRLIFSSDGFGGHGHHDLFAALATGTGGAPRNLGSAVNGPEDDFDAAVSPDGRTMVFSSGTMSDDAAKVRLYRAVRSGSGQWGRRRPLGIGCSDFAIGAAFAATEPGVLYYSAKCDGGQGRMDIRRVAYR